MRKPGATKKPRPKVCFTADTAEHTQGEGKAGIRDNEYWHRGSESESSEDEGGSAADDGKSDGKSDDPANKPGGKGSDGSGGERGSNGGSGSLAVSLAVTLVAVLITCDPAAAATATATATAEWDEYDWARHGYALAEEDSHAASIIAYDRALHILELVPSPLTLSTLLNKGHSLGALGREEEAVAVFTAATTLGGGGGGGGGGHNQKGTAAATVLPPDMVSTACVNLGSSLHNLGRTEEAVVAFADAVQAAPASTVALHYYGRTLSAMGQQDEAQAAFAKVLAIDPAHPQALHFHRSHGPPGTEEAGVPSGDDDGERGIGEEGGAGGAGGASGVGGVLVGGASKASGTNEAFIREEFDMMAEAFDRKLVGKLKYRVPELIFAQWWQQWQGGSAESVAVVAAVAGREKIRQIDLVVDAGVGTGLVGALFRKYARRLIGIDLSPGMVKEAKKKGIYDELIVGGVVDQIEAIGRDHPGSVGLVVAGDVLVYFAELSNLFSAVSAALEPGVGMFAFSTEAFLGSAGSTDSAGSAGSAEVEVHGSGEAVASSTRMGQAEDQEPHDAWIALEAMSVAGIGWQWQPSGRCAHSREYVLRLARGSGMKLLRVARAVGRLEKGKPVKTDLFVFRSMTNVDAKD